MSKTVSYFQGAERPVMKLWLEDDDGNLINLTGYSFVLLIGQPGFPAVVEKTTGIVGQAGVGKEPNGTPNCVVTWDVDELDVTAEAYDFQLVGSQGSDERLWEGVFIVEPRILPKV